MKEYYELHVTFEAPDNCVLPEFRGWSHSAISGDIVLGAGRKQYLTQHAHREANVQDLISGMEGIASALKTCGLKVLRTKVERVIYDSRTPEKTE
jgi:hypothetical protein